MYLWTNEIIMFNPISISEVPSMTVHGLNVKTFWLHYIKLNILNTNYIKLNSTGPIFIFM